MARLFDGALSEYLKRNEAVISTNIPFAMVCWFNVENVVDYHCLMSLADDTADNVFFVLLANGGQAGDPVSLQVRDGVPWEICHSTAGFTAGVWHHAAGIWLPGDESRAYIDGANKGVAAAAIYPINNATGVGALVRLNPANFTTGMVAEAAIYSLGYWPGALTSDKADNFEKILPSLAAGYSPLFYPLGLNNYWPLFRAPEQEIINNKYLVAYNTPGVADHPEIILPRTAQRGQPVRVYQDIPPFMQKDLITPYSGGAWLWLCEIAVPGYDTQYLARNTEDVNYFGKLYKKSNIDIGKQEFSGGGSIPRIQLRISQGPDKVIEGIVNASEGAFGGTVKLIRVNEKFLNYKVDALEINYGMLVAESDAEWVYFTLGIPNPLTQRIPLRVDSSKICPWALPALFKGPECQYSGEDVICTGTFDDCYTKGNSVHWGGEVGLDPNVART